MEMLTETAETYMTDKDFKEERDSGMVPVNLLPERNLWKGKIVIQDVEWEKRGIR